MIYSISKNKDVKKYESYVEFILCDLYVNLESIEDLPRYTKADENTLGFCSAYDYKSIKNGVSNTLADMLLACDGYHIDPLIYEGEIDKHIGKWTLLFNLVQFYGRSYHKYKDMLTELHQNPLNCGVKMKPFNLLSIEDKLWFTGKTELKHIDYAKINDYKRDLYNYFAKIRYLIREFSAVLSADYIDLMQLKVVVLDEYSHSNSSSFDSHIIAFMADENVDKEFEFDDISKFYSEGISLLYSNKKNTKLIII